MAKNITLKDKSGNQLLPLTTASQVVMSDNSTLEASMASISTQISSALTSYLPLSGGTISGNLSVNGAITENGYAMTRRYGTLAPFGTRIQASETNKTDLNQIIYLKVGNYYCSGNAEAQWLQNSPTPYAFMMQVLSPLSQAYDNETTGTWVYRLRKIQVYRGEEYIQQVYSNGTAGNFIYGPWKQTARTENIPTGLPLGAIFTSAVPVTDANVHLLDGTTISQTGMYAAFATYLKSLQSAYPNLFVTESNWQTIVAINGECGKFVIDNTAGTIRLPKIINFIQGTVSLSTIGDAVAPGLPNITGSFEYKGNEGIGTGVFYRDGDSRYSNSSGSTNTMGAKISIDASLASPLYGASNTVQPRSILYPYYIVLATLTKAQTVTNIDNIATDVNLISNKVSNVETNLNKIKRYVTETYRNGNTWYTVYSDGWKECGTKTAAFNNTAQTFTYPVNYTNVPTVTIGSIKYPYNSGSSGHIKEVSNVSVTVVSTSSYDGCFIRAEGY